MPPRHPIPLALSLALFLVLLLALLLVAPPLLFAQPSGAADTLGPNAIAADDAATASDLLPPSFSSELATSDAASCNPGEAICTWPQATPTPQAGSVGTCTPLKQQLGLCQMDGGGGGATECGPGPGGPPDACTGGAAALSGGMGGGVQVGGGNPINLVTGNKYQREVDLPALPGVLGLELVRHYNAQGTHRGLAGRNWRLSYEAALTDAGHQVQITQADGRRITLARGQGATAHLCASPDAADGQVVVAQEAGRTVYHWRWPSGQVLSFGGGAGASHPLQSIRAPSGELLTLAYSAQGDLLSVRDPQGRTLRLAYSRQGLLASVQTPLSHIGYTHDSAGRLTEVTVQGLAADDPTQARRYHYEPARQAGWAHALTGISARQAQAPWLRLATYAYDDQGRAVLTTKGLPRGEAADGGIEQLDLRYEALATRAQWQQLQASALGRALQLKTMPARLLRTRLTSATGQPTEVLSAIVGGHYRLLGQLGPGCTTCGPANTAYDYDTEGRLLRTVALDTRGQRLAASYQRHDGHGRLIETGQTQGGQTTWLTRYRYRDARFKDGSTALGQQPVAIARPSVVPGRQAKTVLTYNPQGQVLSATDLGWSPVDDRGALRPTPLARTVRYTYATVAGRSVLTQLDGPLPNGPSASPLDSDITRWQWDGQGRYVQAVTQPGGVVNRVLAASDAGLPLTLAQGQQQAQLTWSPQGALVSSQQGRQRTALQLDAQGLPAAFTDAAGRTLHTQRDAAGRVRALRDEQGHVQQTHYDAQGQLLAQVIADAQGRTRYAQAWLRDDAGRLLARLTPERLAAVNVYDDQGRWWGSAEGTQATVLPLAQAQVQTQEGQAQGQTQQRAWQDPSGATTRLAQAPGLLLVRDALARVHVHLRDDWHRQVLVRDPDRGLTRYRYDPQGLWAERVDALGQTLTLHADALGRLVAKAVSASVDGQGHEVAPACTVRYAYDAQGRRTAAQGCGASRHWDYDAQGRLVAQRRAIEMPKLPGQPVTFAEAFAYDAVTGELATRTLAGGQVLGYRYEAQAGRLSGMTVRTGRSWRNWLDRPQPLLREVGYAPFGPRTTLTYGNGVQTALVYDQGFAPMGLATTGPQAASGGLAWLGMGTARADGGPVLDALGLVRDARGRVAARLDGRQLERLHYDGQGNLTATTPVAGGAGASALTYNRLGLRVDAQAPPRDALGRLLAHGPWRLTWDAQDRLIAARHADGRTLRWRYDDAGMMLVREAYEAHAADGVPQVSYFHYDGQGRLAAQTQAAAEGQPPQIERQYVYLGLQPVAVLDTPNGRAGATELGFVQTDHLGTPRLVTDENGRVRWRGNLDAWGQVQPERRASGPEAVSHRHGVDAGPAFDLALRLPGMWADDDLGLHYNVMRWYDPSQGRYLSPDPMGLAEGTNAYSYVGNQPSENIDPWGAFKIDAFSEGKGIHAEIVKDAFTLWMRLHNKPPDTFSRDFIDLVARSNWWTDALGSNQFEGRNHFDNPNDTGDGYGGRGYPYWIQDSINWVNGKRLRYADYINAGGIQNLSPIDKDFVLSKWGPNSYHAPPDSCPFFMDIRSMLRNFSENTHTLADFYAHSNWVDTPDRGGKWQQQYKPGIFSTNITITGNIPADLNQSLAWNEVVHKDIFSGSAEGCASILCAVTAYTLYGKNAYDNAPAEDLQNEPIDRYIHNVFDARDDYGNLDKRTHAYWAKDEPDHGGSLHRKAKNLATEHTRAEISRLYETAKNKEPELLNIFKMSAQEMQMNNILYWIDYINL